MSNAGLVANVDAFRQHCFLSSFSFFLFVLNLLKTIEILTLQFVKLGSNVLEGTVGTCNDSMQNVDDPTDPPG